VFCRNCDSYITKLTAERDELKKDAERYRWLRDEATSGIWLDGANFYPRKWLNPIIDEAMKEPQ
jgi:hypothetical protein